MSRLDRMQRISSILEIQENDARTALAKAEFELTQANNAVTSVLEQCRHTAHAVSQKEGLADTGASTEPLSFKAARTIVQSGWMEANHRETVRDDAAQQAQEKRMNWQRLYQRQEAAARLVDRWDEQRRMEADRRSDAQLDDLINARRVRTLRPDAGGLDEHTAKAGR